MESVSTTMPGAESSPRKSGPSQIVVPAELPEDVASVFIKSFHESQFQKGFQKILKAMDTSDSTPIELTEEFMKVYERQLKRLRPHEIDSAPHAFRAGLAWGMLHVLPKFRMEFANKGYNYLFLQTYLKKRVLSEIQGLSVHDIDRRILQNGHRPKIYLDDQLHHLVPETYLKRLR